MRNRYTKRGGIKTVCMAIGIMRKLLAILICVVFTSCVTVPYDINSPRYILSQEASIGTSLIPGLTQIINGEYVKGGIIMATTLGAIALTGYAATGALDTINEDTGEKTSGTQGAGILAAGGIVYSYIDGVISTNKLNKQKVWALGEPERRRQQEEARIEQERQQIEQERQQEEARIEQERRQEEAKFAFTSFVDVYTKKAIQAGSPILIVNQKTEPPDFLNSVDCRIEFINISKKRIKYVDFTAVPYNRVDDIAYSESRKTMRVTDFIQPSEYYSAYWENIWFNSTITYMKIIGIEVTYDDNTTQAINNSKIIENSSLSSDEYTEYKRLEIHADGRILTGRVGSIL